MNNNNSNYKTSEILNRLKIIKDDITSLNVQAIVNSANQDLLGGSGVDGAIHKAAGPQLLEECRLLKGCKVGQAKITKGYNLPAKYVIHTVGPIWEGGNNNEEKMLASCYLETMKLASNHNIKTIAFPSISTGVFGFPIEKASAIALRAVCQYLSQNNGIEKVYFVTFSDNDKAAYSDALYYF